MKTAKSLQRWLRYKDRYTSGKLMFPKKSGQPLEIHPFESGFKRYHPKREYAEAPLEAGCTESCDNFVDGFRLGAWMMEVLSDFQS